MPSTRPATADRDESRTSLDSSSAQPKRSNSTLELYEERESTVVWQNNGGEEHTVAISDGYSAIESTEPDDEPPGSHEPTTEATTEMVAYPCEIHSENTIGQLMIHERWRGANLHELKCLDDDWHGSIEHCCMVAHNV